MNSKNRRSLRLTPEFEDSLRALGPALAAAVFSRITEHADDVRDPDELGRAPCSPPPINGFMWPLEIPAVDEDGSPVVRIFAVIYSEAIRGGETLMVLADIYES